MATYSHRTVTTVREEFIVPVSPYGAPAAEIAKAWNAADRLYRNTHKLGEDDALADDAIRFRPGDGEIVISFDVEEGAS